ncbi:MAG: hypothetical protein Q8N37_04540 [bacterium]|nr:hypothetical protein [bacterium]
MPKKLTMHEVIAEYDEPEKTRSEIIEKYLSRDHCTKCGCALREAHE